MAITSLKPVLSDHIRGKKLFAVESWILKR